MDEIIQGSEALQADWVAYKRMLKTVQSRMDVFGTKREDLQPFRKLILLLEDQLLEGFLFRNCIDQVRVVLGLGAAVGER